MSRLRHWALPLLAAVLLAWLPGPAAAQSEVLLVAAGQRFGGDIASLDRPILIQGVVEGDVTSWSGAIRIEGEVRGDVVSYAGAISLGPAARVAGSVLSLSGGVSTAGSPQVAGRLLGGEPLPGSAVVASVASLLDPGGDAPADLSAPLAGPALLLPPLLLSVACAAAWPRRTRGAGLALRMAPGRSAALGLLGTLALALLLPAAAGLLAISLLGLPLLPPLLLLLQAPYLFGLAALARALAEERAPGSLAATALAAAGLLLPLALLAALAPLWALAGFYMLASLGLGAAVLSRGGSYLPQPVDH